jgi:lipopolysaccharide heptosyltransferase II
MHDFSCKKILLLRTDRLGDVILSTPVARVLKKHFPASKITFLVRQYTQPLAEDCAHVDEAIAAENFYTRKQKINIKKLVRFLRAQQFDTAIHLFPRPELALATYLADIPIRIGSGYRLYSFFFNKRLYEHRKTATFHEAEYNLRLLQSIGIVENKISFEFRINAEAKENIDRLLVANNISSGQPVVILHPCSGGSAREWPLSHFAALARMLSDKQSAWIIFTGTKEEKPQIDRLIAESGMKSLSLAGRLSLKELAALLHRADVFVSNSTGPLHLAVAMGTEVVAFYPPITPCRPERWGPYGRRNDVLMSREAECRACKKESAKRACACMKAIPVQQAYEKIAEKI